MGGLSGAGKLKRGRLGAQSWIGSSFLVFLVCRNLGTARRFSLLAQLYCHPQRQPEKRHTGNALVGLGRHLVAL